MVDSTETPADSTSMTNAAVEKIAISYDNMNGAATLMFNSETAVLRSQKPASGIWYKNDKLRGKGNDITLTKEGKVIYEYPDDIQTTEAKNDERDTLNMTFNNSAGILKA